MARGGAISIHPFTPPAGETATIHRFPCNATPHHTIIDFHVEEDYGLIAWHDKFQDLDYVSAGNLESDR